MSSEPQTTAPEPSAVPAGSSLIAHRSSLLAAVRAANPLRTFFGPIFQKEVRTAGRKRSTYWLRALFAGGLLVLVAMFVSTLRDSIRGLSGLQRFQTLQSFAPYVTMVVVWFQFIAVALIAPILASPAICEEKRAKTLPALMTTPLTTAQIAFGKLSARLVQLVILSLLSAPLLLAIRVFGGLEAEVILAAACISISTAVLGASLGLMYSVWHRRAATAAMFALFTLALIQGGPSVLQMIIYLNLTDPAARPPFPFGVLSTCSPAVLGNLTAQMVEGTPMFPGISTREMWVLNTVYNSGIAAGIALVTAVFLRRVMLREAGASPSPGGAVPSSPLGGGVTDAPSMSEIRRGGTEGAPAPTPPQMPDGSTSPHSPPSSQLIAHRSSLIASAASAASRQVSDHPVLWREVRLPTFGSRRAFRVAVALTVLSLVVLYLWAGLFEPALHATLLVIAAINVMVLAVFLTAGGISGEREARTWDALVSAPLTARSIVTGKWLGALKAQWFVPAVVLADLALAAAVGVTHPVLVLHGALILAGPILLFTSSGVLFSLLIRRTMMSAVANLVLALLLWAGSWVALGLTAWFLEVGGNDWTETAAGILYAANPVAISVPAAEQAVMESGFRDLRSTRVYSVGGFFRFRTGGFTLLLLALFAGYAAAGAACLLTALAAFRRLSGRSS